MNEDKYFMKLSQNTSFANTEMFKNFTYRRLGQLLFGGILGVLLFMTPLFKWNWIAMMAYLLFVSIILGHTPTNRNVLTNLYKILFKKPVRMVVTDYSTTTTIGHGIREVGWDDRFNMPTFKMNDGHTCYVFNVTSGISRWSQNKDYLQQAVIAKGIYNTFEPGEALLEVVKEDNDTGMLKLEKELREHDNPDILKDPEFKAMADKRYVLLHRVGTQENGRSVQQYAILKIKAQNVDRCYDRLKAACRVIRPASNPLDILLSAEGLEGGVEIREGED